MRKRLVLLSSLACLSLAACSDSDQTSTSTGSSGGATSATSTGSNAGGGSSMSSTSSSSSTSSGGAGGSAPSGLTKVGTGEYETFFLVDGVIYGYGASNGTLGMGTNQSLSIPAQPIATPPGLLFKDVQGGLHQSMAVDVDGNVWTWGDTSKGLSGSGTDGGDVSTPYKITEDATGAAFGDVISVVPTSAYNSALKSDGSVWVWGDCSGGVTGDGTKSGMVEKPTKVPLPAGVKIVKLAGASALLALADDGTVYAWGPTENPGFLGTGNDDQTVPRQVQLTDPAKDISAGYASFFWALSTSGELFGWGYRGTYLGINANNNYNPTPKPISMASTLNLPKPVAQVSADYMTTHVILTDGTLWGWGDDPEGEVGDGQELDYSKTNPPYAWDYGSFEKMVFKPVQLVPSKKFAKIFSSSAYDFYDYALTTDGELYSWGRNKTGTVANGVYPLAASGNLGLSSEMCGTYPNSWDVTTPTLVDPLHVQPVGVNSPYCVANPNAKDCI